MAKNRRTGDKGAGRSEHQAGQGQRPGRRTGRGRDVMTRDSQAGQAGAQTKVNIHAPAGWSLLLLLYYLAATYFPAAGALDPNASRFLALSVVNLGAIAWFAFRPGLLRDRPLLSGFFTTPPVIAWSAFLLLSLLSFTKAFEPLESVLQLAKLFTVFTAAFVVALVIQRDLRMVHTLAVVLGAVLLFEAILVFFGVLLFLEGSLSAIHEIKLMYANKNILSSALFLKLPFAVYLLMFQQGTLRRVGWFGLFFGIMAIFFLAARAFYIGIMAMSAAYLIFLGMSWLRKKDHATARLAGGYLAAFVLALVIVTLTQQNLYRDRDSRTALGVTQQIATLGEDDVSTSRRLDAWRWSAGMIGQNPLLGVGSGNWKIAVLEYDNRENPDFFYMYKAHNDLLEHTAEAGIPAGLAYLALIVLGAWPFLRSLTRGSRGEADPRFPIWLLAAGGMGAYFIDALANFPADRPGIQILFVIFAAFAIASWPRRQEAGKARASFPILVGWVLLMLAVTHVMQQNYRSARLQKLFITDINTGGLELPATFFAGQFPAIPRIALWGGPVSTIEARYLLNDGKTEEAINLLHGRVSSPWDSRREYFLSRAYLQEEQMDSAMHYAQAGLSLKPYNYEIIKLIGEIMERDGRPEEALPYLEAYVQKEEGNEQAWMALARLYQRMGQEAKVQQVVERARELFPDSFLTGEGEQEAQPEGDPTPIQQPQTQTTPTPSPHEHILRTALTYYDADNYAEAIRYLDEYISLSEFNEHAHGMRAYSHFRLEQYEQCIADVDAIDARTTVNSSLINFRGVSYERLGNREKACENYARAMAAGLENGRLNYERYCMGGETGR